MIPDRIIDAREPPFPIRHVSPTAARPKQNAVSCTPTKPNPSSSANAAPKLAPLATPNVSGVARGFANMLWNTQPETESPAPTSAASSTRGSRIDQRTVSFCRPMSCPCMAAIKSLTGTLIRPTHRQTNAHRTGAARNIASCAGRSLPGIAFCRFMLPPKKETVPPSDTVLPTHDAAWPGKYASLSPQFEKKLKSRNLSVREPKICLLVTPRRFCRSTWSLRSRRGAVRACR